MLWCKRNMESSYFKLFNPLNNFILRVFASKYLIILIVHIKVEKVSSAVPYYSTLNQGMHSPCVVGAYYEDQGDGSGRCRRCTICPKGEQVSQPCSARNDTICEVCPRGTYNDVKGGVCRNCSSCELGQFQRRHCRSHKDTKCQRCPLGTFSARANVGVCRYCSVCNRNEEELRPCKPEHNRKCGDCKIGYFRVFGDGCRPCSRCSVNKTAESVVPECRDRLGPEASNICWPTERTFVDLVTFSSNTADGSVMSTLLYNTETDFQYTFHQRVVLIACCFSLCFVFIIAFFAWVLQAKNVTFYDDPPFLSCLICEHPSFVHGSDSSSPSNTLNVDTEQTIATVESPLLSLRGQAPVPTSTSMTFLTSSFTNSVASTEWTKGSEIGLDLKPLSSQDFSYFSSYEDFDTERSSSTEERSAESVCRVGRKQWRNRDVSCEDKQKWKWSGTLNTF